MFIITIKPIAACAKNKPSSLTCVYLARRMATRVPQPMVIMVRMRMNTNTYTRDVPGRN